MYAGVAGVFMLVGALVWMDEGFGEFSHNNEMQPTSRLASILCCVYCVYCVYERSVCVMFVCFVLFCFS